MSAMTTSGTAGGSVTIRSALSAGGADIGVRDAGRGDVLGTPDAAGPSVGIRVTTATSGAALLAETGGACVDRPSTRDSLSTAGASLDEDVEDVEDLDDV